MCGGRVLVDGKIDVVGVMNVGIRNAAMHCCFLLYRITSFIRVLGTLCISTIR